MAGAFAGGIEAVGLALTVRLLLSSTEVVTLAVIAVVADAALGAACGVAGGLFGQFALRRRPRWRRYRAGFVFGVILMTAFFVLPMARELWERGQRVAASGMIGLICSVGVMSWFNAGYWYRREMLGAAPRIGWKGMALLSTGALALISPFARPGERIPESPPPTDAPDLILITVDTLRRDHVGAFDSIVNTPVLDRLVREGAAFDQAITSLPETEPAHASMFTGLAPVQTGIVANGMVLANGHFTVAEMLAVSGWRTGAFVSSYAVDSSTGLDQGFAVYDDDFLPALRGISEVRTARAALKVLMRFGDPANFPSLLERKAPDTISRALRWADHAGPSFLWVHLFEPHSPYESHVSGEIADAAALAGAPAPIDHRRILALEPGYAYTDEEKEELRALYREEVEYVDTQVGVLLDGLRAAHKLDNALVIVTGDHGESLGEHDINFNHHGLYDDVVRVPLIVWSSQPSWTPGTHVSRQVTVADIANTLVEAGVHSKLGKTDSLPLTALLAGDDVEARPILLMGRLGRSLSEGRLFGVRDPKGVKYIRGADTDELYELTSDPGERANLAAEQPEAVKSGRANVEMLRAHVADGPNDVDAELKALGYTQ